MTNDSLQPTIKLPVNLTVLESTAVPETENTPSPADWCLGPNYPNPFNAGTVIIYEVPRRSRIDLKVYDIKGALVADLAQGIVEAGRHQVRWEGRDDAGRPLGSGVYVVRLHSLEAVRTCKVLLVQ